ncbi:hypothetical protein OKW21_006465 [Catalinimonas alkaloidigena]|uniref:hypothetical protein n=1 Tax=Catalinimonas alkaloidigena TaxID=1075417 RepID=UPI002405392F|nr:hypothetical protein [Catalinimonas alkaloidigena]MDF9801202.1 hypothetical protein [Catalinimonas alkaloidigena]
MATANRIAPVGETFSCIEGVLQTVEIHGKEQFGQGFLDLIEEGAYLYNSEPPAHTLTIAESVSNNGSIAFVHPSYGRKRFSYATL